MRTIQKIRVTNFEVPGHVTWLTNFVFLFPPSKFCRCTPICRGNFGVWQGHFGGCQGDLDKPGICFGLLLGYFVGTLGYFLGMSEVLQDMSGVILVYVRVILEYAGGTLGYVRGTLGMSRVLWGTLVYVVVLWGIRGYLGYVGGYFGSKGAFPFANISNCEWYLLIIFVDACCKNQLKLLQQ